MNKNYRGTFYIVEEESKEADSANHERMSDHNPINDDNDDQQDLEDLVNGNVAPQMYDPLTEVVSNLIESLELKIKNKLKKKTVKRKTIYEIDDNSSDDDLTFDDLDDHDKVDVAASINRQIIQGGSIKFLQKQAETIIDQAEVKTELQKSQPPVENSSPVKEEAEPIQASRKTAKEE